MILCNSGEIVGKSVSVSIAGYIIKLFETNLILLLYQKP